MLEGFKRRQVDVLELVAGHIEHLDVQAMNERLRSEVAQPVASQAEAVELLEAC